MKRYNIKTIILPIVLFGCGTLSLKLREESGLREFEYKVLRRTFRHKRNGVTGDRGKLHNGDHRNSTPKGECRGDEKCLQNPGYKA